MTAFSEPAKWAQALGATANADVIPDEAGAMDVDISKIFPAVFSIPLAQGGKAIPRRTLNGIFKTLGDWVFYNQNGGVPSYNADFDYTVGRLVSYNSAIFKCIHDNAHAAPHNPTDADYWAELSDSSSLNDKADKDLSNVSNAANILMAHNAMPSERVISLTKGESGTVYTAPADGFFYVSIGGNVGQFCTCIVLTSNSVELYSLTYVYPTQTHYLFFIPISKNMKFKVNYTADNYAYLQFIYANGSVSEVN